MYDAKTLEKQIKSDVSKLLDAYNIWYNMPVPGGYGESMVDYVCCHVTPKGIGRWLAIEAKRPDKWLTPQQRKCMMELYWMGAKCFCISNSDGVNALHRYLKTLPPQPVVQWKHILKDLS